MKDEKNLVAEYCDECVYFYYDSDYDNEIDECASCGNAFDTMDVDSMLMEAFGYPGNTDE